MVLEWLDCYLYIVLLYGQNDIMFMLEYSLSLEWLDYYLYIVHWYHYGWSGFLPLNFTPHLEMEGWQWPSRWQLWKTGFKMKPGWMQIKSWLDSCILQWAINSWLQRSFQKKKKLQSHVHCQMHWPYSNQRGQFTPNQIDFRRGIVSYFFLTVGLNNYSNKIPHIIVLSLSGSYIPIHSIGCLPCESGPVEQFSN